MRNNINECSECLVPALNFIDLPNSPCRYCAVKDKTVQHGTREADALVRFVEYQAIHQIRRWSGFVMNEQEAREFIRRMHEDSYVLYQP